MIDKAPHRSGVGRRGISWSLYSHCRMDKPNW
jgi:hypothetical protein